MPITEAKFVRVVTIAQFRCKISFTILGTVFFGSIFIFISSDPKPFCKSCYSRLQKFTEKAFFKGKVITQDEFKPIETFIDRERKELREKSKMEEDARIKAGIDAGVKQFIDNVTKKDKKENVPTTG